MEKRTKLRTYSHLAAQKRVPGEYEIATSRLHYYPEKGFAVKTPVAEWFGRYQRETKLVCADWDRFEDPRATTYTRYTFLQRKQETFVDGLLESIETRGYDSTLSREWCSELAVAMSALRFPTHALQMGAAYLGQLAPSGRLTIALLFQAADEVRKIQRYAYRVAQLRAVEPGADALGRAAWQTAPEWQPLRKLMERTLSVYDWSQALVAWNLCIKPALDELFLAGFGKFAAAKGDVILGEILGSLHSDSRWQLEWTSALVRMLWEEEGNRDFLLKTREARMSEVKAAVEPWLSKLNVGWDRLDGISRSLLPG